MKKLVYIIFASLVFFSCRNHEEHGHDAHNHDEHKGHGHEGHDHQEESGHHESEVQISEKQAENLGVKIGPINRLAFSEVLEVNGELELAPQNKADVHVMIGGIVSQVNVREGSRVKKGQVLAILNHPDIIKIQEDLVTKSADLVYLEEEFNRQKRLYNEEVGSGKEFQKIRSEYIGAKALVESLKAKVHLLGLDPKAILNGEISSQISVLSPLSGTVSIVGTNIGTYVSTDKRLFQVVDNGKLHCAFSVYEKDVLKVDVGQVISVNSPSFGDENFTATVYAISPSFEDNPRSVKVQASIAKPDSRLISGMYVSGKIKTDSLIRMVVPRTAIVTEEDKSYVFSHHEDDDSEHKHEEHHDAEHGGEHSHMEENDHKNKIHFQKIEVKTGVEEGKWVEILNTSDFPKGVEIALTSAYYLQAEIGKGETEHVH